MTLEVERNLRQLAAVLEVTIPHGLSDDEFVAIAQRLVVEFGTTFNCKKADLERIIWTLRPLPAAPPKSSPDPAAYVVATPAGAPAGASRSKVTRIRSPRGAVHPACKAAWADGATVCWGCAPRLHPATCDCEPCNYWWDHGDDDAPRPYWQDAPR